MCKVEPENGAYQGKWSYTKSNEVLQSNDVASCTKEIVHSIHSADKMEMEDLEVMNYAFQHFKTPDKNALLK